MRELFKQLIVDFQERTFKIKKRLLNIPLDTQKIVVLVGVRRCGKTSILYQLIEELRRQIDPRNIIYINFEDERLSSLTMQTMGELLEAYYELYPQKRGERLYLFFDEIQEVKGWEKFVRRVYDQENVAIYLTGSSAKMLSRELPSALRGRTITYEIFPLSFREFLDFKEIEPNLYSSKTLSFIKNGFFTYLQRGGFPEVVLEESEDVQKRILRDYADLIVYKDVIERYGVKNLTLLKFLIRYAFTNPATLVSFNKLYNDLRSMGFSLAKDTLYNYFAYLHDAYTMFLIPIFRNSIKEEMRNPKKLYIIDNGFHWIYAPKLDRSKQFENLVFLALRQKEEEIFYFQRNKEVDFYLPQKSVAINVSYEVDDPQTLQREVAALQEIAQIHTLQKLYLLNLDKEEKRGNIELIPLWKFLLRYEEYL